MKEVNLKQILCEKYECELEDLQLNITLSPSVDILLQAMKQACEQTVDLCAENIIAETINAKCQCGINVNQVNSILNTKNQIQ